MISKYLLVFIVGGCFSLIAQLIIDKTKITPARTLVMYVCAGVLLSALGLYAPLVELAGAGATVPLTGFGHAIAEGVRTGAEEKGLLGAIGGGLTATSTGITATIVLSLVASIIFKSKPKK